MNHGRQRARGPLSCLLVLIALLTGCGFASMNRTAATGSEQEPGLITLSDRVLVLPLRDGSCLPVYGNHVMCHLTGEHFDAGDVPKGTGAELAAVLFSDLQQLGSPLIPFDRGIQLMAAADPIAVDRYEPQLAVDIGQRTGATKVLMGVLTRYEERSGSWFGTRDPAAVAFSLALVDVATGAVTHKLRFNRRQAPLSTDLLALPIWWKEGFRWWTRREVAAGAMAEAARALTSPEPSQSLWTNMPTHPSVPGIGDRHIQAVPAWQ